MRPLHESKKQFTFHRLFVTEILQTESSLKATTNYYFNLIYIADSFVQNVMIFNN